MISMNHSETISKNSTQTDQRCLITQGKSSRIIVRSSDDTKKYVSKVFSNTSASYESFLREVSIHSLLSHPNIIQYISVHEVPFENINHPTILMEYAPFGDFFNFSLDHNIKDEKLIRTFFHHLIEGLDYLHSSNIAHLDLKLENLLLGGDLLLKIADFDLARKINRKASPSISRGGTMNYRPPEILSGICSDYRAADIYSAGICLYTLLTGTFPFAEEGDGKLFRYDGFVNANTEFWDENEDLISDDRNSKYFSESLRELLNKMWMKDPSERIKIKEIKHLGWYNQPTYSMKELKRKIKDVMKN